MAVAKVSNSSCMCFKTRCWFQIFFDVHPEKLGKMNPFSTHIFQMGGFNHQLYEGLTCMLTQGDRFHPPLQCLKRRPFLVDRDRKKPPVWPAETGWEPGTTGQRAGVSGGYVPTSKTVFSLGGFNLRYFLGEKLGDEMETIEIEYPPGN